MLHYVFIASLIINFIAMIAQFIYVFNKNKTFAKGSVGVSIIGCLVLGAYFVLRWMAAGRLPLSNQFEFAMAFALGIDVFYVILRLTSKHEWYGTILLPAVFLISFYAALLPSDINELMPALRSEWFALHIISAVLSYSAFAVSACLSVKYLLDEKKADHQVQNKEIDYLAYKFIGFGILMLTVVILSGCIWAEQAWSRFWSWDPKETWALITWIIYAIYLHQRLKSNWQGRKMAILAIVAFIIVIFTFVGVNTLLSGLHSYA